MFNSESDLARSLVLWHLSKEMSEQVAQKNLERLRNEPKEPVPARRRFWHRNLPKENAAKPQAAN
jgi:hypothetical protein